MRPGDQVRRRQGRFPTRWRPAAVVASSALPRTCVPSTRAAAAAAATDRPRAHGAVMPVDTTGGRSAAVRPAAPRASPQTRVSPSAAAAARATREMLRRSRTASTSSSSASVGPASHSPTVRHSSSPCAICSTRAGGFAACPRHAHCPGARRASGPGFRPRRVKKFERRTPLRGGGSAWVGPLGPPSSRPRLRQSSQPQRAADRRQLGCGTIRTTS
jgi:hypothetical protein